MQKFLILSICYNFLRKFMRQAQACRFSAAKLQIKTQIIIIYIYTSVINDLNKNRIPMISQSSGIQTARLQRNIRYKDRKPVYPNDRQAFKSINNLVQAVTYSATRRFI